MGTREENSTQEAHHTHGHVHQRLEEGFDVERDRYPRICQSVAYTMTCRLTFFLFPSSCLTRVCRSKDSLRNAGDAANCGTSMRLLAPLEATKC